MRHDLVNIDAHIAKLLIDVLKISIMETLNYNDGQNGCCLAYIGNTSNLDSNYFVHCNKDAKSKFLNIQPWTTR